MCTTTTGAWPQKTSAEIQSTSMQLRVATTAAFAARANRTRQFARARQGAPAATRHEDR